MNIFSLGDIRGYEWIDLHDKDLTIKVIETIDGIIVSGIDEGKNVYILHLDINSEN